MNVKATVTERFDDFIFDWDYEQYLLVGGYGSGKSYAIGTKLILKALQEKRKILVVREVYETIKDSCYDLLVEILNGMNMIADESSPLERKTKVIARLSPMSLKFPNGSQIIFKGMDKPAKVKSINGVSIVWLEECSEIKYDGYKELLGRVRTPNQSMHFILSCNPVSKENWVYRRFFVSMNSKGKEKVILDEEKFYKKKTLIKNGIYYHHSTPDDNPFLPIAYIRRLDDIKNYDEPLYLVARFGRFGPTGSRVLPQIEVARTAKAFTKKIRELGPRNYYYGFDFGFEESYNAVISMAVDSKNAILYIFDEIYENHITDDRFADKEEMQTLNKKIEMYNSNGYNKIIVADNEDPKAISYYRQRGFKIRACRNKFAGSRLSNTRKIKRFRKIVISPKCVNTIRELKDLTYAKKSNGDMIYDQFNIDPHTFSAIWYALDMVTVADPKKREFNTSAGKMEGTA